MLMLTLSHIQTLSDASAADDLHKHFDKMFSTLIYNQTIIYRDFPLVPPNIFNGRLLQMCCMS